jgi:hypothetical protein
MYHFSEGGRHIEDTRQIKADKGFRSLIDPGRMPGPDAIGEWLRQMGGGGGQEAPQHCNDMPVRRYLKKAGPKMRRKQREDLGSEEAGGEELTLDVDARVTQADKGDGEMAYDGTVGQKPMLGFLSDGRRRPCCSHVKCRPGNASPQVDIEEAIRHALGLVEEQGRSLEYFRSDSAGHQSDVIDLLDGEKISYTITADQDEAAGKATQAIPEGSWDDFLDRDGFKTGREVSETVHTMNDSDHAFRLVVWRKQVEEPSLFALADEDFYRHGAVITNVPEKEMSTEEVLYHHRGRGNAERSRWRSQKWGRASSPSLQSGAGQSHLVWDRDADHGLAETDAAAGASVRLEGTDDPDTSAKGASSGGEGDKKRSSANAQGPGLYRADRLSGRSTSFERFVVSSTSWLDQLA